MPQSRRGFPTQTRAGRVKAAALRAAVILALTASAQGLTLPPPEIVAESVFVPDSAIAAERFALAERLERASEWAKAAEVYQELLDSYRDRVVVARPAEDPNLFESVADRALRHLAAWPAEGLAVYNGRFQPAAEAQLNSAKDSDALQAITDRYLLTRAGQMAAEKLIQLEWDQGELGSAARRAERLCSILPADSQRKGQLLMQAGIAWHLARNGARAQQILEQLKSEFAQAKATVAGREVSVVAELEAAISRESPEQAVANAWPTFGGTPDRAVVPNFMGRSDALLFSVDVAPSVSLSEGGPNSRQQARVMLNQSLGVYPVYDNRQLFFQDGVNLHAVSIDGGMQLPGWQSTSIHLAEAAPVMPVMRTLAVTPDSVYCVLSDLTAFWGGDAPMTDASAVICVDRMSGKIRWKTTPSSLAKQRGNGPMANQFASAPLIVDDRLYVAARGGRSSQFQDIYLLCLQRDTGRLLWSSYIASGPNALMSMEDPTVSFDAGTPQLSFSAGRVVVVTNSGVIAAIEAGNGAPAWLRAYARPELASSRMLARAARMRPDTKASRIFAPSPAIISGGRIFALPVDGLNLMVVDEVDGRIVKSIPRASMNGVDTLVGLVDSIVVVAGERVATALDWMQATEERATQQDAVRWSMDFADAALRGRPFLTADCLFLPTDERLLRIATDKWKIQQMTPAYPGTWEAPQGPGNVLVTEQHVVMATASSVNVYTDLSAASERLDREIAAAANPVDPLVRYAELLFAAGEPARSVQKLNDAMAAVARSSAESDRQRLFSVALTCATRMAQRDSQAREGADFLNIAQRSIASPNNSVRYHFAAAEISLRRKNVSDSVAQLQAILDDAQQRMVLYKDPKKPTRHAAQVARERMGELIAEHPGAYEPIERQAQSSLSNATAAGDSAALLELARRYPNSNAAPGALFAAGRILEKSAASADAISVYRQLLQDYSEREEFPTYVEAIARAYAAVPGKANIAAGRLARAAATHGNPTTGGDIRLPNGRVIPPGPFAEVANAIKAAAGATAPEAAVDIAIPSADGAGNGAIPINVSAEKILPQIATTRQNYGRAVAISSNGDVVVLDGRGKVIATFAQTPITAPAQCAWISDQLLLLRNANELAALDLNEGKLAWRVAPEELPEVTQLVNAPEHEEQAAPADGAPRPGEGAPVNIRVQQARLLRLAGAAVLLPDQPADGLREIAIVSGKVIFNTSTGRLGCLDSTTGKLLWQLKPEAGGIGRLACTDDFTAAKISTSQQSILLAVDNETGRLVFTRGLRGEMVQNIAISDDGQLVYTTNNKVAAIDLFESSGKPLFEQVNPDPMVFFGQVNPNQLLLSRDLIATTTRSGSVYLFSRYTGKFLRGDSGAFTAPLRPNRPVPPAISLAISDPYIFAYTPTKIRALHMHQSEFRDRILRQSVANLTLVLPAQRHLIAIEPAARAGDSPTVEQLSLYAFSRAPSGSGESGRLDHYQVFKPDGGVASWQLVEGGLYLASGDKRLLFYPAASK